METIQEGIKGIIDPWEKLIESSVSAYGPVLDNLVSVKKSSVSREQDSILFESEGNKKQLESDDDYISSSDLKAGEDLKTTKKKDIRAVIKDETNSLDKMQTEKQKGGGDGGRARDKETDKQQEQHQQKKQWELRKRSATKHKCTRVAADSKVLSSVKFCKPTTWMMMILFLFVLVASADADCKIGEDPKCPITRDIPTRAVVKGDSVPLGYIPGHDTKRFNLDLNVSVATRNGLKHIRCRVIRLVASNSTSCPGLGYEKKDTGETDIILRNVQEGFIFNLTVEGINYFSNFSGTVLVAVPPASSNDDRVGLIVAVVILSLACAGLMVGFVAFIIKKKQEYKRAQVSAVQSSLRKVLVYTDNPQTRKSSRESGADELPRSRSSTF